MKEVSRVAMREMLLEVWGACKGNWTYEGVGGNNRKSPAGWVITSESGVMRRLNDMMEDIEVEVLSYQVRYALDCIKWLDSAPHTLLGTHVLDRAWEHLGEIVDGALEKIGAEKDEEGQFVCHEEEDGPKNELKWWLEDNCGTEVAGDSGD